MNPSLTAISPIDGRYFDKVKELSDYFSEYALIKYRIKIEALYLIELSKVKVIRSLNSREREILKSLYLNFKPTDAEEVKKIERKTNHDVKAVEYYIKGRLGKTSLKDVSEMVHFGLTSEDINNLAYSCMITDAMKNVYLPNVKGLVKRLMLMAGKYRKTAMLARTHGQIASPTTLGKEIAVFVSRISRQLSQIKRIPGKINGATGNYNAHHAAFPKINWVNFSKKFVSSLGLEPNLITTQIESHDGFAELFHCIARINNIVLDLDRDVWLYISYNYLIQAAVKGEIGSSTMPHKVNPIDFENSEGNIGIANAILEHLASKLQVSRLQRDLSDSTAQRAIGTGIAHSLLAYKSTIKGLDKLKPNSELLKSDLESHPEVLAEAIQTVLRREGFEKPYEALKELTRGKKITTEDVYRFVDNLKISEDVKKELKKIRPGSYTGIADRIVKLAK